MAASDSGIPRVTFLAPEQHKEEVVTPKKLGKLTVKYNRKEIQRRIKLEEWIDAQIQTLYEDDVRNDATEPEIDMDDLLDLPCEERKSKIQEILQECTKPTDDFTQELMQRLKGLRKISTLQHK